MKRAKKHKVKAEKPETSTSYTRALENHDLAYYIHDRVELMHQVFSVIKSKDIRAMAPDSVRKLPMDDLQELCTEELLGISSKRLCAVLDGAEPPSDTESSSGDESPPKFETISLDSISSDEEIMSQSSKKKKHKHRKTSKGDKKKKKLKDKSKEVNKETDSQENTKACRAGLTVLELLELQARARAIRAQLQQEHANKQKQPPPSKSSSSSDSEVEIKEEAPDVVEISSDDEKPNLQDLAKANSMPSTSKEANKKVLSDQVTEKNKDKNKHKEKKNKKDKSKKNKNNNDSNKTNSISTDERVSNKESINTNKETAYKEVTNETNDTENAGLNKVTKRINNLIITVPQQHTKKIKLNRTKITVQIPNVQADLNEETPRNVVISEDLIKNVGTIKDVGTNVAVDKTKKVDKAKKEKSKKKKRQEEKSLDKEGSDHDEITLQLSDTEKMDLLEDFDRKALEKVSSSDSTSSDSESDSSDTSDCDTQESPEIINTSEDIIQNLEANKKDGDNIIDLNNVENDKTDTNNSNINNSNKDTQETASKVIKNTNLTTIDRNEENNDDITSIPIINDLKENSIEKKSPENEVHEKSLVITDVNDLPAQNTDENSEQNVRSDDSEKDKLQVVEVLTGNENNTDYVAPAADEVNTDEINSIANDISQECSKNVITIAEQQENDDNITNVNETDTIKDKSDKNTGQVLDTDTLSTQIYEKEDENKETLSDGQLSDHSSSEVEVFDLKPEVLCISDEEDSTKLKNKKQKKQKKSKKNKKKKSKSDFREGCDQNFYKDDKIEDDYRNVKVTVILDDNTKNSKSETFNEKSGEIKVTIQDDDQRSNILDNNEAITIDDDEVMEILELSDDSSCYEVEGTVLSKEPTVAEIQALSAVIDDIKREDIITDEEIRKHEKEREEITTENEEITESNPEYISWKDRYLGSKKVMKVLTTSNILNAIRKKNKDLKKKMEESKRKENEEKVEKEKVEEKQIETELEEGTIYHYNTLQGSSKYIDPIKEVSEEIEKPDDLNNSEANPDKEIKIQVTGEMKKDAKQLLKMYKRLLKYNDITKQKDPIRKKKKSKKKKDKAPPIETVVN